MIIVWLEFNLSDLHYIYTFKYNIILINIQPIEEFIKSVEKHPTIDVRSPSEFSHAFIPTAKNICLLNDEERKVVGIKYKKEGNQAAVVLGYDLVGTKFSTFIKKALDIAINNEINVYCWRGGLRSNIMAFVLHTAGFKVNLLKGGYKAFRNWTRLVLQTQKKIIIIGGKTGSGKTLIIESLREKGEQVINLEAIANHKGSAFGALGQLPQPSNEQFENILALLWNKIDCNKSLWLENESRTIGSNVIPLSIFEQMREAITLNIQIPQDERINYIIQEYGCFAKNELITNTTKIKKRLGNLRLEQTLEYLNQDNIEAWAIMMLEYYDKSYIYGNSKREDNSIVSFDFNNLDANSIAEKLIEWEKNYDKVNTV